MKLSSYTLSLLDDIERMIDPDTEDGYIEKWRSFFFGECGKELFSPMRKRISAPSVKACDVHINDALGDYELMLDYELTSLSKKLSRGKEALGVRANYGTGIMTSLFGAEIFRMPREMNTLPSTRTLGDTDKIRELVDKGIPDLYRGFGKDVLYFGEFCSEVFDRYPKIKKYVKIYHPDTQGPLDIAELLWGGDMFYEMYDDPDFVHSVMRLITDTYKAFMDKWYSIVPREKELSVHWSVMHRGNIMLRLDSATNISLDFYNEYSRPYDSELLAYFGGGCMHFCGRGDHYVESLCDIDGMYGFNMSQPHLNNLDRVFSAAAKRKRRILWLRDAEKYAGEYKDVAGLMNSQ